MPVGRWPCCCAWSTRASHETAPARPDELPRYHPPRDRIPRPRCGGGQRRQRDREVFDDRGARPAAELQGPIEQEGCQAGQADPRRRWRRDHRRNLHRPLSIHLPQAFPQALRDAADGAGAAPRAAHRRRGARAGSCAAGRDRRHGSLAGAPGAAGGIHRRGGSVRVRRTVARARCGGRRSRCALRGRTAADRPHRRRIPPLLHPNGPPDRRVGCRRQAAARRRRRGGPVRGRGGGGRRGGAQACRADRQPVTARRGQGRCD